MADSHDAAHNIDEQRFLVVVALSPKLAMHGDLRREMPVYGPRQPGRLGRQLERLEPELDDVAQLVPRVDGVAADALDRDGDDGAAADEC